MRKQNLTRLTILVLILLAGSLVAPMRVSALVDGAIAGVVTDTTGHCCPA